MKYLIAGNGPAAVHAAKSIRRLDAKGEILLVSPENNPPYSRITVPEYLTGELTQEQIYFEPGFYEECRVQTRLGRRVASVSPFEHKAVLDDGETLVYDRMLIASGSHPFLPPWADLGTAGVYSLWNKADAEAVSGAVRPGAKAVIVGGGLVGMQAARALSAKGMQVSIVEMADRLMAMQLDETAAGLLKTAAEKAGVQVRLQTSVQSLETRDGGVSGVLLGDGSRLEADCVLVCVGVRPNLEFLDGLEVEHARGIETDARMRTALPDVYAAGDVVKTACYPDGEPAVKAIWLNAVEQGEAAGENMAGGYRLYEGSRSMNSIELFGLSLICAGQTAAGEDQRELTLTYPTKGSYCKLVMEGDELAGMILAGDVQQAGLLTQKVGRLCGEGFWGKLPTVSPEMISV